MANHLESSGYFSTALAELTQTVNFYRAIPTDPEQLATQLSPLLPDPAQVQIFKPLLTDIATFATRAQSIDLDLSAAVNGSPYLSPDAHRFLADARLIGLIPLDIVTKLRHHPIISIGASVAASTLDLLVSQGAENITLVDGGILEPSNMPRMPQGDYRDNGQPKVEVVARNLRARNPFLNLTLHRGRALADDTINLDEGDITFSQLLSGLHDPIIIEAIDHPNTKIGLRRWLRQNLPHALLMMPTDVGLYPFVSVEQGDKEPLFNQPDFDTGKDTSNNPLAAVYAIVNSDFPADHQAQFLSITAKMMTSWSQTPMSARESAVIATKLALHFLRDGQIKPGNYHIEDLPHTLMPYSKSDLRIIASVASQLFVPSS